MTNFYQPGESRWGGLTRNIGHFLMGAVDPIGAIAQQQYDAMTPEQKAASDKKNAWEPLVKYLNEKPVSAAPLTGTPADPLSFGTPTSKQSLITAPLASGPKLKSGEIPDVTGFLSAQLGVPVQITSGYRSPSANAAAGGVSDSAHMKTLQDGSPMAYDFKPQGMSTGDAARLLAQNLKGQYDQIIAEGDHVHISFDPKGRGQALMGDEKSGYRPLSPLAGGMLSVAPSVTPGDTSHFPSMLAMDPAAVGSLIPAPHLLPTNIKLPPAPQAELPADLSPLQGIDKEKEMEALRTAYAVKPRDSSHDAWDRFAALLQGAAQGATGADIIHGGVGNLLLHAGAGAGAAYKRESDLQTDEQKKYDEMTRQANIALAQQGFNIDMRNIDVGNQNIERGDTSKERQRVTKFTNAKELFDAQLQQLDLNLGNQRANAGALNARDMARAQATIGAMEGQAEAGNKANLGQTQLNLAGGGTAGTQRQIAKMLTDNGVDPLDEKAPHGAPARQTALGVINGQVDTALNGFAQDLVANGGAQEVLAPNKGDSPEFAKAKAQALRALKQAKKPGDAASQQAVQTLAQMLNGDHNAALAILKNFAARGYPTAKLILGANQGAASK